MSTITTSTPVRYGYVDRVPIVYPRGWTNSNAVTHNPVKVKRPKVESYEGKTPALGDGQARALLDAPGTETEKGKRDRAILSVLLYHGLRREELCTLKVRDIHARRGVLHLRVHGKGGKVRYLPLHPGTAELVADRVWRALTAGYGGHQRARPRGRHRQGAGVARACQHRHHPALRSEEDAAGG